MGVTSDMPISIRRSQTTATPSGLVYGELAYSEQSSTLFIGDHAGASIAIAGAGVYAKLASPNFTGTPQIGGAAIATQSYVTAQGYITGNQSITLSGKVTGSGTTAITTSVSLLSSDIPKTLDHTWVTDFLATVYAVRHDQLAAPTASVSWNSQALTGLASPVNAADAATKAYVDAMSAGLVVLTPVAVATTAAITLTGLQTIDGYTTLTSDRVLVKNQASGVANGIYVASSGAWARSADCNTGANAKGDAVYVSNGSVNISSTWVQSGSAVVGTDAQTWSLFTSAGNYSAGNGLQLVGSQFSSKLDGATLAVSASGIKLSDSYAGQTTITTLGTVTAGTISSSVSVDGGTF